MTHAGNMKALVLDAEARSANVRNIHIPRPVQDEVLIHVKAVALNPVDALYTFNPLGRTGRVVGSDFAGVIVATSLDQGTTLLGPNTRVAGFLQGACSVNERPGAFAEYLICPMDLLWIIPDSLSFEEAATISLCALTAAQALFYRLQLPAPFEWELSRDISKLPYLGVHHTEPVLNIFIYGASTSVALYAAQLLQHFSNTSNRKIRLVGAASKSKFSLLRSNPYLYDSLVDYRDEDWVEHAQKLTDHKGFHYAFDCISEGSTVEKVCSLLHSDGKIAIVRSKEGNAWDSSSIPSNTEPLYGAVWEGLGTEIQYQNLVVKADPIARSFATTFFRWLSTGARLQANPVRAMPGGLPRVVQDGFLLLGAGTMEDRVNKREEPWMKPLSAEKMVYRIDSEDTP